jgi:hypothetical protein
MEYFGRNLFVMNILAAAVLRKVLKIRHLHAGNRG